MCNAVFIPGSSLLRVVWSFHSSIDYTKHSSLFSDDHQGKPCPIQLVSFRLLFLGTSPRELKKGRVFTYCTGLVILSVVSPDPNRTLEGAVVQAHSSSSSFTRTYTAHIYKSTNSIQGIMNDFSSMRIAHGTLDRANETSIDVLDGVDQAYVRLLEGSCFWSQRVSPAYCLISLLLLLGKRSPIMLLKEKDL